ncbi:MAG: N-acetylmuramoyl-L-alanine amidase [Gemmatimonadota bacterium]
MTTKQLVRWACNGSPIAMAWLAILVLPLQARPGQESISVRVQTPTGFLSPALSIVTERGFAAASAVELARLGWTVDESAGQVIARWRGGSLTVEIRPDTPFLSWGGEGVHLTEAPYLSSGRLYLPLQFFIDVLPWKLPEVFQFDSEARILVVKDPRTPRRSSPDPVRVVVIDPGHGGRDPGARGTRGTQEKEVALAIGLALARNLRDEPNLSVFLTRDADTLIPIWKRGELATDWKGERPGVFVSIHANALPGSRATRGFETYFLSEARTEHERRVAALENAAQEYEREEEGPADDPDLGFILTELRNLDHQHWSALLAELVQDRLEQVHPGPNRGVKQGPLAVITNALMPAVLVEVGFLTNPEEESLLVQGTFQENAATAIAAAVREFFRRYPTGGWPSSTPGEGS